MPETKSWVDKQLEKPQVARAAFEETYKELQLANRKLEMALMAMDNGGAGIEHNPNDWCAHCYFKAWAERVRALT